MNSSEDSDRYWAEQIKTLEREIAELENFLGNNQNAVSPEGEDTSESMANAETDLEQTKHALKLAKIEYTRIQQQEEIAELLPRIEELKRQIEMHKRVDTNEARELEEVLREFEYTLTELQQEPVIDDEEAAE